MPYPILLTKTKAYVYQRLTQKKVQSSFIHDSSQMEATQATIKIEHINELAYIIQWNTTGSEKNDLHPHRGEWMNLKQSVENKKAAQSSLRNL